MELHQLKTLVAVAREGSITRASARLHLSQPAVSAHIKAMEEALGLALFERTARGMRVTREGQRILLRAEQTLGAHQELLDEARRIAGRPTGRLRVGAGGDASHEAIGKLLTTFSERCPEVEVALEHRTSLEVVGGLRDGSLDAGFYSQAGEPEEELTTVEVAWFGIQLVAPPGLVAASAPLDWGAVAELPWIHPTASACCGRAAERLFTSHRIRPKRIISVDREDLARKLIAGGVGVGLLHADAAVDARARGEVELLWEAERRVRVVFGYLASRARDPLLTAATSILRTGASA